MNKLLIVLLLVAGTEICSAQSTTNNQIPEYCNRGILTLTKEQKVVCLKAMAAAEGTITPPQPNIVNKELSDNAELIVNKRKQYER